MEIYIQISSNSLDQGALAELNPGIYGALVKLPGILVVDNSSAVYLVGRIR
ncbi:MAG: hypothetical protein AAEJ43_04945 [Gammaproteobacteria bacterium]